MAQWYVKELSKLTDVSVQTLHHYDRIDLLKPSIRLPNGYRLYSEKDLLKLQQIIALKYFGFALADIKTLLAGDVDVIDHFNVQSRYLEEKAKTMLQASDALKNIISGCNRNKSIPWETIIKLIEVYRMTQELENSWEKKALNEKEFQEYVEFNKELPNRFTAQEKQKCHDEWEAIVKHINASLTINPDSKKGEDIAKRVFVWVNNLYGKENAALRQTVWEKGFKGGHGADEHGLSAEAVQWLDQAFFFYNGKRIKGVLAKVESHSSKDVLKMWNDLMEEICGNDNGFRQEIVNALLQDADVSQAAKSWLKKLSS